MRITLLEYGSLLSYVPKGETAAMDQAREVKKVIKADSYFGTPPTLMSQWIAETIRAVKGGLPFASFFREDTILVPLPSSSLMQRDSLWVPERLSSAMVKAGLGRESVSLLARETPVPKAALSIPSERPKTKDHIASLSVQKRIQEVPRQILLVDDIITRGATALGAANRLGEVFPMAQIRTFAAMRTVTNPADFQALYHPVIGTVQYIPSTEGTSRRPP